MKKLLVVSLLFVLVLSSMGFAWWNNDYDYRYQINNAPTLETPLSINDTLGIQGDIIWGRLITSPTPYLYTIESNAQGLAAVAADNSDLPWENETTHAGNNISGLWNNYDAVWHLDDVTDSTGDMNITNNGATFVAGVFGNAADFQAGTDRMNATGLTGNDSQTIEVWFNPDNIAAGGGIFDNDRSEGGFTVHHNGLGGVRYGTGAAFTDSPNDLVNGNWYHLVGIFNASDLGWYFYLNASYIGVATAPRGAVSDINIGMLDTGDYYDGTIDEARIYDGILTYQEILDRYNNGIDNLLTLGSEEAGGIGGEGFNATQTFNGTFYELFDNTYDFDFTIDATVADVDAILEVNATNYTATKVNTTTIFNFTGIADTDELFTSESESITAKWYYNVSYTNGTLLEATATDMTQTTSYSYGLSSFTGDASNYLVGTNALFTTTFTNESAIATLVNLVEFNNTNYTGTQSGNDFTRTVVTPNVDVIETFDVNSVLQITYSGTTRELNNTIQVNVANFNLTSCNDGSDGLSLVFNGLQEKTRNAENFTMDIRFDIFSGSSSLAYNVSFSTLNTSQYLCINPTWASALVNATIDYNNEPEYDTRSHLLRSYTVSNTTSYISLFMLNTTDDDWYTITVTDAANNVLEDIIIQVQRWYIDLDLYDSVAMGITGLDGKSLMNFESNDAWYRFVFIDDSGDILKTTSPSKINGNRLFSITTETYGAWYNNTGKVVGSCASVNATNHLVCTINHNEGTSVTGNLIAYEMGAAAWDELCSATGTSNSMTLPCLVGNVTGKKINFILSYTDDDTEVQLINEILDSFVPSGFGNTGILVAIILIISAFLLGVYINMDVGLITFMLGIITSYLMGFLEINITGLISIIGVIIVILVMRGSRR